MAARRPVVVGNGMEGEPLSSKDAVLLTRNPHLVLDGLEVLASAMRARRAILAIGPDVDPAPVRAAARVVVVDVVPLEGGFVAGQETALVNRLNGGAGSRATRSPGSPSPESTDGRRSC